MDYFTYQNDRLLAEQVDVGQLAQTHGTPLYIYSRATLERHWQAFDQALADRQHLICYAVKANSNIALLALLARLGPALTLSRSANWSVYCAPVAGRIAWYFPGLGKPALK